MTTYRLTIVFDGVDFDDDDVYESLGVLDDVVWNGRGSLSFAMARVEASTALAAAVDVAKRVCALVPTARPLRIDPDLVAIPDIAARVGVDREAVRNWVDGKRRMGCFPPPFGVVGKGVKVWSWRHVNQWLGENLELAEEDTQPSDGEVAEINVQFSRWCETADRNGETVWTVAYVETEHLITVPNYAEPVSRPLSWMQSRQERCQIPSRVDAIRA